MTRFDKLKLKLFVWLTNDLKTKFVDGTINFVKEVMPINDLFSFTRSLSRRQSFVRTIRTVNVKKGKIKYTLLFVQTLDGEYRVNLGRHHTLVPERGLIQLQKVR